MRETKTTAMGDGTMTFTAVKAPCFKEGTAMREHVFRKTTVVCSLLILGLLASSPAKAGRRTGDKSTLRVPAARTQLVQDLLQHSAEADAAAEEEAERLRRARELVAAAEREATLRAAIRPTETPTSVPAAAPVQPSPIEARMAASAPQPAATAAKAEPSPTQKKTAEKRSTDDDTKSKSLFGDEPSSADGFEAFGGSTKLALGVLVLFAGAWFLRRKKNPKKNEPQIPSHLRCLGNVPLGKNWQISLLELPGEVLVLGTGEAGVQVLTRIDDEEHIAELRRAQEKGGKGLGKHIKGLMGMLRPSEPTPNNNDIEEARPCLADPRVEMASPAELVEMQRALDMHRAFGGRAYAEAAEPTMSADAVPAPPIPAPPVTDELELETMRQRLADLRAGRFAQ